MGRRYRATRGQVEREKPGCSVGHVLQLLFYLLVIVALLLICILGVLAWLDPETFRDWTGFQISMLF